MTAIHPTLGAGFTPPSRRRFLVRAAAAIALAPVVLLGGWAAYRFWTYPNVPDVRAVDLDSAISFMGTDDFNRMLERHRLKYALAVVDRLGQASFSELLAMLGRRDENRARIAKNLRLIEGRDQLGSRMFAIFLEKYYALSPVERQAALLTIIAFQQGQIARHPEAFGLPTIDEFKRDMTRFMARQPPRVQAMCGQFLLDIKRQRDAMGLKDPF